jgi:hypothetical protein
VPFLPPAPVSGVAKVPGTPSAETPVPAAPGGAPAGAGKGKRRMLVGAGLALAAVLVASGVAYAQYGRDRDEDPAGGAAALGVTSEPTASPSPTTPADELCTDEIKSNRRWVCLTSAVLADGKLTMKYDVEYAGSKPDVNEGYHVHFYGSDGTYPPDHVMGSHAPKSQRGKYYWDDKQPSVLDTGDKRYNDVISDAKKVCARIAVAGHGLVPDNKSGYTTGNCIPIKRS